MVLVPIIRVTTLALAFELSPGDSNPRPIRPNRSQATFADRSCEERYPRRKAVIPRASGGSEFSAVESFAPKNIHTHGYQLIMSLAHLILRGSQAGARGPWPISRKTMTKQQQRNIHQKQPDKTTGTVSKNPNLKTLLSYHHQVFLPCAARKAKHSNEDWHEQEADKHV